MKGRYGHAAGAVVNDTLLITGGYRGSVLGDLLSMKLPPSITGTTVVSAVGRHSDNDSECLVHTGFM